MHGGGSSLRTAACPSARRVRLQPFDIRSEHRRRPSQNPCRLRTQSHVHTGSRLDRRIERGSWSDSPEGQSCRASFHRLSNARWKCDLEDRGACGGFCGTWPARTAGHDEPETERCCKSDGNLHDPSMLTKGPHRGWAGSHENAVVSHPPGGTLNAIDGRAPWRTSTLQIRCAGQLTKLFRVQPATGPFWPSPPLAGVGNGSDMLLDRCPGFPYGGSGSNAGEI